VKNCLLFSFIEAAAAKKELILEKKNGFGLDACANSGLGKELN
jgi:hypothetical protein